MSAQALIFPGQGTQASGMGRDLAEKHPEIRALFERAGEVLGYDLARICFEGPDTELTRSDHAQPAIFLVSVACAEALKRARPALAWAASAGLSSGEWAALYVADVLGFDDALRILQARGRFMQEACEMNPGAMTSVLGLDPAALQGVCDETGAEIANMNSPEQTVLSGTREAIEAAEKVAVEKGARRAIRLNVAGAFHSSLMRPAAEKLDALLEEVNFRPPTMTVLSNATGRPHGQPEDIRRAMVEQVTSSVRWVQCVRTMGQAGVGRYVECGPGRVLSGLVKRIDKQAELHNICDLASLEAAVQRL